MPMEGSRTRFYARFKGLGVSVIPALPGRAVAISPSLLFDFGHAGKRAGVRTCSTPNYPSNGHDLIDLFDYSRRLKPIMDWPGRQPIPGARVQGALTGPVSGMGEVRRKGGKVAGNAHEQANLYRFSMSH